MDIDTTQLINYHRKFIDCLVGEQRVQILTQVGKRMGIAAESVVSEYPEPSGKPLPKIYQRQGKKGAYLSKFKSRAQQGKVFALAKEGKIPYSRTGTLAKSITSRVASVTASSVVTEIGTNLKYAPYVIGDDDKQSNYHKGTWMTLAQDMNRGAAKIAQVAHDTYTAEINKRLNG